MSIFTVSKFSTSWMEHTKKEKFVSGEFSYYGHIAYAHRLLRYAGIAVQHFLACTRELFGEVRIYTD